MHVLVLHSRYLSGASSGENRVVADEVRVLRDAGHAVTSWMPSVDELGGGLVGAATRAIWSRDARAWARRCHVSEPSRVVHVHNVFPSLSPSVLRTGSPTVMTLHNFRLACVAASFLRDGRVCEDCLGAMPWRGVLHGCYRGSRTQSMVIAASLSLHRMIGTLERVNIFAAVSQFIKDKLAEAGLDADRIRVRHNFSWPIERRMGPGAYFVCLARLSPEKGLETVVRNWRARAPLMVVGDGPDRRRLESIASSGVTFRGAVEAHEVPLLLRRARSLLVPSTCYEGSPRSIVEAFAAGVPVIASRIGGLPEHVEHGVSGLLVEPRCAEAWAAAIEELEEDDLSERLGDGAYRTWEERFSPDVGLRSLEALYSEAIARAGTASG